MEKGYWGLSPPVGDTRRHPKGQTPGSAVPSLPSSRPHIPKAEAGEMTSPTWKMSKPGAGLGPAAVVLPRDFPAASGTPRSSFLSG